MLLGFESHKNAIKFHSLFGQILTSIFQNKFQKMHFPLKIRLARSVKMHYIWAKLRAKLVP